MGASVYSQSICSRVGLEAGRAIRLQLIDSSGVVRIRCNVPSSSGAANPVLIRRHDDAHHVHGFGEERRSRQFLNWCKASSVKGAFGSVLVVVVRPLGPTGGTGHALPR